jgi:hypothetical protein
LWFANSVEALSSMREPAARLISVAFAQRSLLGAGKPHVPLLHVRNSGVEAQARAQAPQFARSLWRSTQRPLQNVSPVAHTLLHTPRLHAVPVRQVTPQPPQLALSFVVLVSQPLAALRSQSAKPALQVPTAQAPVAQVGVALATVQARPQAPQLVTVRVLVSQPLSTSRSQSAKPEAQLSAQFPVLQVGVALAVLQASRQAPQCCAEVLRLVSQPLAALPSQSPKPALQLARPHTAPTQLATPLAGVGQARLQAPQWRTSARVSTQALLHSTVGAVHEVMQVPLLHTCPAPQARPQAPQFAGSLAMGRSQPLAALPSQFAKPEAQTTVHAPDWQTPVALGRVQLTPQLPQFEALAATLTSQPFAGAPSQSAKPALQVKLQAPPWQVDDALARAGHALPHAPQVAGDSMLASQPLAGLRSQSANPC